MCQAAAPAAIIRSPSLDFCSSSLASDDDDNGCGGGDDDNDYNDDDECQRTGLDEVDWRSLNWPRNWADDIRYEVDCDFDMYAPCY